MNKQSAWFTGLMTGCILLFGVVVPASARADLAFNWETSTSSEPVAPDLPYCVFSCSSWGMLQVNPENDENMAPLEQVETYDGNPMCSQQWRFEPTGDGYYLIRNANSGRVIDASMDGSWTVKMWDYAGVPWHHWQIVPMGNAKYKFRNRHTGKYLTIGWLSSSLGVEIGQWDDCGANDGQMFHLMFSVGDSALSKPFRISSKACSDLGRPYVWDNLYANPNNYATIGQCAWWGGANQQWTFEPVSTYDSAIVIRNGTAGGVVDGDLDGFGVKLWSYYAAVPWQHWYVEHVSGPWFKIRNRQTNLLLTMNCWSAESWSPWDQTATLIEYYDCGNSGQLWQFDEVQNDY